jgi:hypothetical protein
MSINTVISYNKNTVDDWNSETFANWIDNMDLDVFVERYAEGLDSENNWKGFVVEKITDTIGIQMAKKIIYEIGIRRIVRIVKKLETWADDDEPDVSTDAGFKNIIWHLAYEVIEINEDEDEYP